MIEPLIAQANTWTDVKPVSTDSEAMIAYSLKQMSKIKLNRYVQNSPSRLEPKAERSNAEIGIPVQG